MIEKEIEYALTILNIRSRYEYIYDTICDYLDNKFTENNYCDFIDDACVVNRGFASKNRCMGCCYSFSLDFFMNMRNKKVCQYLDLVNKRCITKNISCKLYTCNYLEKKGISFKLQNFTDLNRIFTKNQMRVLKYNCFKTKDAIIDRLLEVGKNKLPHFLFCLFYLEKAKEKTDFLK